MFIYVIGSSFGILKIILKMHLKSFGLSIVTTFIQTPPLFTYDDAENNKCERKYRNNNCFRAKH